MTPAEQAIRSYEIAAEAKAMVEGDATSGLRAVARAIGCELVHQIGPVETQAFLGHLRAICADIRPANDEQEIAA